MILYFKCLEQLKYPWNCFVRVQNIHNTSGIVFYVSRAFETHLE
jgi:hypothetical protein